jgi:hydroxymethylpyrimidine pyrophosphatase-like HAD family hydrolase
MAERAPVPVTDLLSGAEALAERLRDALRDQQWLDAYLLAVGLGQVADDRLHADLLLLHRAASYLGGKPSRQARLAAAAASRTGKLCAVVRAGANPAVRRLARARQPLAELTSRLADQVLAPARISDMSQFTALLRASVPAVSPVAGDRMRIPTGFHSFDQHPDDVRWLVRAFMTRYPERRGPLCVVGVRTSGSYLAPLHAAAFRACGESSVDVLTYRPGRPFLRSERAVLSAVAQAGGWVLIADDPPGAGTALARTARAVTEAGVPGSRIVFLISSFGTAEQLPAVLRDWAAVVQPWADWSIHGRLACEPVRQALSGLVGPEMEVREVRSLGTPCAAGERGHLRGRFSVRLADRGTGEETRRDLVVEGAGLGYLGRQGVAVADAIAEHVPHVYGFADGLLYRDWLPPATRPGPGAPAAALAEMVASYVYARRKGLPAPTASVDRLAGRDPAWEVAAKVLSGQYGRLSVPARPLLLEPLIRRLLEHGQPTVLDGKTGLGHWLPDPAASGELRKVDFYQRGFGHHDLACYDPVFDLAGAAADPPTHDFEQQVRRAYQRVSGDEVDGERWLLYRLAQLWRLGRAGDLGRRDVRQRSAAAVHDYLAELYLRGLPPATGPLCAIDLDGVLECHALGFPATSPTGALALRALVAHGYRPVLATGRSVPEVRDRCLAFGLAGGVAEYGAALYRDGEPVDLRPAQSRVLLDRVRDQLSRRAAVMVDPRYQYSVRASCGNGPLPADIVNEVRSLGAAGMRIVQGAGQTDIIAAGTDKGSGLRGLAALMSDPGCAFAMGDTPPDIPLFACAQLARAPRNANFGDSAVSVQRTRHAYQAGLSEACGDLLGHRPGRCRTCRPPAFTPRTKAMLAVLDLRANGLATIGTETAALSALAVTRRRW